MREPTTGTPTWVEKIVGAVSNADGPPLQPPSAEQCASARRRFVEHYEKLVLRPCALCGFKPAVPEVNPSLQVSLHNELVAALLRLPEDDERYGLIAGAPAEDSPFHLATFNGQVFCIDPDLLNRENGTAPACELCFQTFTGIWPGSRKGPATPKRCYRTGCDFGRKLERFGLQQLRPQEVGCLALCVPFTTLRQIRFARAANEPIREQTISFPVTESSDQALQLLTALARRQEIADEHRIVIPHIAGNVVVNYVGRKTFQNAQACELFNVTHAIRKEVVDPWIRFLMKHNALYRKVARYDPDRLDEVVRAVLPPTQADIIENPTVVAQHIIETELQTATGQERAANEHYMIQAARDDRATPAGRRLAEALRPLHEEMRAMELQDGVGPVDVDRAIPDADADSDDDAAAPANPPEDAAPRARGEVRARRVVDLDRPIGEFSNTHLILFGGMPHLFPVATEEGIAKFKKPPALSTVRRLLLNKEPRWAQDGNFLFFNFNSHRRHELARTVHTSEKAHEIARELLEDDGLLEKLEADDGSPETRRLADRVAKALHFINRRVPFSNAARRSELSTLLGMHAFMGCPGIFVTINPCDNDIRLTIERISNGDPAKFEALLSHKSLRTAAVQANPAYAAESFGLLIDAVVKDLFEIELDQNKRCHLAPGNLHQDGVGIFGLGRGLFGAIETQGRGALHIHCLFWGPPTVDFCSERMRGHNSEIKAFVDSVSVAEKPPEAELPEGYRATLERCPTDWDAQNDEAADAMRIRDYACSIPLDHKCTIACFKNTSYDNCRFAFPRPAIPETGVYFIGVDGKHLLINDVRGQGFLDVFHSYSFGYAPLDTTPCLILPKRSYDSRNMSEFNVIVSRLLGCNINVVVMGCVAEAHMRMFYLIKYLTKPITLVVACGSVIRAARAKIKYGSSAAQLLANTAPDNADEGEQLARKAAETHRTFIANALGNRALGQEEISAQFAALMLLDRPAELKSHATTGVAVWPLVRRVKQLCDDILGLQAEADGQGSSTSDSSDSDTQGSDRDDPNEDATAAQREIERANAEAMLEDIADDMDNDGGFIVNQAGDVEVRGENDEERGRVMQDRGGLAPKFELASINFLHRGAALSIMNFYMYVALVKIEKATPQERAEENTVTPRATAEGGRGRRPNSRFHFAPTHPDHGCFVQVIRSKPYIPSPFFVPRWSHSRESTEADKLTRHAVQCMEKHAEYFFCLFAPISASDLAPPTFDNYTVFLGQLRASAANKDVQPTKLVPWPRAICHVLNKIIETMRIGLNDAAMKAPRAAMAHFRYDHAYTKQHFLDMQSEADRNRFRRMLDEPWRTTSRSTCEKQRLLLASNLRCSRPVSARPAAIVARQRR
jgi:hypothetical protein